MIKPVHPAIRELANKRRTEKMSIGEFAEKSGYSESYLSKLECGMSNPTFGSLSILADTLGFEVIVTLKEKDKEKP